MNRRELLLSAGGMAVAGVAGAIGTDAMAAEGKHEHNHGQTPALAGLVDSSLHCVKTAELCIDHCIDVLATGDPSLAECARRVQELEAACTALFKMASWGSPHLKETARLTAAVCKTCETECRKHKKHKSCLDCADACAACLKECEKILG